MIKIKKSGTADSRTCDWSKVDKETLLKSSKEHIEDVKEGMRFFINMIEDSMKWHDHDKISDIDGFHKDFTTGFKETSWWDNHRIVNRHHLLADDGVRDDVNLVDVIDMIVDCVMAGMGRTGSVYPLDIKPEVLMKAFNNTVELLKSQAEVEE